MNVGERLTSSSDQDPFIPISIICQTTNGGEKHGHDGETDTVDDQDS
jgi:hypothetical protein